MFGCGDMSSGVFLSGAYGSYVAPLMLFVMIGYPIPLPHILIVQALQESIRVPHI